MPKPRPFLKPPNIHIDPSIAKAFRRRAWKRYPAEYAEFLWGFCDASNIYVVTTVPVKQEATKDFVIIDPEECDLAISEAREHDLYYLGMWHTHPCGSREPAYMRDIYTMLSTVDHKCGSEEGDIVWPVSVLWVENQRRRSKTRWWIPQPKLLVK